MKKFLIIILFIIGLCVMPSCTSDISEDNKYGSIAGSVSDATTGEPVPTVRVKLTPGGNSTVTGTDGSFNFLNLEPAEYVLDFSKEGYKANSAKVNVKVGAPTSAHLLIERIPSIVTADRETLDFGDNQSLNTLSFNIVNSGYEKLKWEIEEHCEWITEINPSSGELDYGKTAGIVVVIDRELLNAGENKAVIVIKSSDGSSEMNVVAIGEGKALPALNTLDATEVTSTSATLNGEVSFEGNPKYTERGFVYSLTPEPTLENTISKLSCKVNSEKEFSYQLKGLDYGKTFYVRAYATNKLGTAYSSNEIIFRTEATLPSLKVLDATNVTPSSATLNGEIVEVGTPSYKERGFVYSLSPNPTLDNTLEKIICPQNTNNKFSHNVTGLDYNKTYYLRAYAVSDLGIVYSTNEISFKTTATLPSLKVLDATNVTPTSATLNGEMVENGNPAYTERGFVYSISPTPTLDNTISKIKCPVNSEKKFSHNLTGLEYNKTYYLRAYAVSDVGTVYSTNEITFKTTAELPVVKTLDVYNPDLKSGTATFRGEIVSIGNPAYTERGFVYSQMPNPTIYDEKIVANGSGVVSTFSKSVSDLPKDGYYVRAYATSDGGTSYGEEKLVKNLGYIEIPSAGIAVQLEDLGTGTWGTAETMCKNSTLGGFYDWRLPTIDELMVVYTNRELIGGFTTDSDNKLVYWSSTYNSSKWNSNTGSYTYYYDTIDFLDGSLLGWATWVNNRIRAVRTLAKK